MTATRDATQIKENPSNAEIALDSIEFRPIGDFDDRNARLIATLVIGGAPHHLEAIAVSESASGELDADNPAWSEYLFDLRSGFDSEGAEYPVHIAGRAYVLFMSPFCR